MRRAVALLAACAASMPIGARAQFITAPVGVSVRDRPAASVAVGGPAEPAAHADSVRDRGTKFRFGPIAIPRRDSSWWVPLVSVVVPGTGQALLGQNRFIAYLAVEGFAFLGYLDQRAEQQRERDRFQSLASSVARSAFPGDLPVGPWSYYEQLEHYIESGVFNLSPGSTFTPEADVTTYNGAAWLLARQTYWTDPNVQPDPASAEYRKAFEFYTTRAVQPQFRWSWRNAQLEHDVYTRTIERANQAARDARLRLGFLIANHMLSMVDAYVTLRVHGGLGASAVPPSLSATIPWAPFGRPAKP